MKQKLARLAHLANRRAIAAGTSLMVLGGKALAEVPTSVTTELTGAKTDVGTIGAAVFAIAVAIVLFKWFRRAL